MKIEVTKGGLHRYSFMFMYADFEDGSEGIDVIGHDDSISFCKESKFDEWLVEEGEDNRGALHRLLDAWLDGRDYTE